MLLVGRERELARLDDLLSSGRAGRGASLLVTGEAGIGKSALLDALEARASGFRVVRTRGVEAETALAFAALSDLVRPLRSAIAAIPEAQAAALRGALALGPPAARDRFTVFAGALSTLAAAAESAPLLVLVDDFQWIDSASAEALLFSARRVSADPIALACAVRVGEPLAVDVGALPTLELDGLRAEAARELLQGADRPVAPPVAERLIAASAGNPLGLIELPRALSDDQLAGRAPLAEPLPVGALVERLFLRRLQGLPASTRRALLLAAASRTGRLATVQDALAREGLPDDALAPAESEGLLQVADGRLEFRHPLVRAAVHQSATSSERRTAHAALADALDGRDHADERAWHLARALSGPNDAAAAELEAVGAEAAARGAHDAAVDLLVSAARASSADDESGRRLLAAARAANLASRLEDAAALVSDASALLRGGPRWGESEHLRATIAVQRGHPDESLAILVAAAERIAEDAPGAAGHMLADAGMFALQAGDAEEGERLGRHAVALARREGGAVVVVAEAVAATAAVERGHKPNLTAILLRVGALHARGEIDAGLFSAACLLAQSLIWRGQLGRGRAVLERAIAAVRAAGAPGGLPYPLALLCDLEFRAGRLERAAAAGSESVGFAREIGQLGVLSYALSLLARVHAARGDAERCRADAAEACELAGGRGAESVLDFADAAVGLLELGLGRAEAAVEVLTPVVSRLEATGRVNPNVVQAAPDLIEALVAAGQGERAGALAEEHGRRAAQARIPWALATAARCRGLLASEGWERELRDTLRAEGRTGSPFERARTELVLGERLLREGRTSESAAPVLSARRTFEVLGALPWSARASRALDEGGRAGGRAEPAAESPGLSPQELQVALRVADGGSNAEVAAALFVTRRTVEFHLTNVYRKLGVRNRTELARWMSRRDSATSGPRRRT